MGKKSRKKLHASAAVDGRESRSFDSLPADLVHIILSLLPGKEASIMATMSKICQEQCPPFLNFDERKFGSCRTSNISENEPSVIFDKLVDDSLSKLPSWNGSHKSIRFHICSAALFQRVNQFLELVSMNKFADLYLDFGVKLYTLPLLQHTLFASKSLTVLHIRGCRLPVSILDVNTRLDTLQELHLTLVLSAKRLIDHLSHICPFIVNFSLTDCGRIDNLILSDLDKLTKVNVMDSMNEINNIAIEAQSLRIFKYHAGVRIYNEVCNINVNMCRNLEVLYLASSTQIKGLSPDICSSFPFLKELFLSLPGSSLPLKIASPVLQFLVLSKIKLVVGSAIDTPNLQYFEWTNSGFFPTMTSTPKEIKISFPFVGASRFLQLRAFMENPPSKCSLSLELSREVRFEHEAVRKANVPLVSPVIDVLNLKIGSRNNGNYIELLDGLLWSCHPKTLSIQFSDSRIKQESIQAICDELCNRETKLNCCRPTRKKCWRHYLKRVNMEQSAYICENTLEERQKLNFNMKWGNVNHQKINKKKAKFAEE